MAARKLEMKDIGHSFLLGICKVSEMGKRSGVPHRDDELASLSRPEIAAELERARMRMRIAGSAKITKLWDKRIHWLEAELARRD